MIGQWLGVSPANAQAALPTTKLSDKELDDLNARAFSEMQAKTSANVGLWHMDEASWSVDMGTGSIVFRNPAGWKISAPLQVIGTFYDKDRTWMWGWDHPSVPEPLARDARLLREFGRGQGLAAFTTHLISATEDAAWLYTALAGHFSGANGAYRGPAGGGTFVYMTFGEVKIAKG
jgi:hypothetical protein